MKHQQSKIPIDDLKRGITIESVLDDFGVKHRARRCACPVHKGDNRAAFSFNDELYMCHTRGCSGDVVSLVMALTPTDFIGAAQYLARRKGVVLSLSDCQVNRQIQTPQVKPPTERDFIDAKIKTLRSLQQCWSNELKTLRESMRLGLISECDFHTKTLIVDNTLDRIDGKLSALNYRRNRVGNHG